MSKNKMPRNKTCEAGDYVFRLLLSLHYISTMNATVVLNDLHHYAYPNNFNALEEQQEGAFPLLSETPSKEPMAKKLKTQAQQEAMTYHDLLNAITALTKTCESTADRLAWKVSLQLIIL